VGCRADAPPVCLHACYHAGMGQITVRTSDELVDRVKAAAADSARSMNEFVEFVLRAVTDPDLATDEADRVRARLRLAGLLAAEGHVTTGARPDHAAVAGARRRAARGTPLSDVVAGQR